LEKTAYKYNQNDQVEEDEVGMACRMQVAYSWESHTERHRYEVILKMDLREVG
jgi:hypothetical protein